MKIRKKVYTCITCVAFLCINKSLLSCTKEIVPGIGLESDCFIGMSLEKLKDRIQYATGLSCVDACVNANCENCGEK